MNLLKMMMNKIKSCKLINFFICRHNRQIKKLIKLNNVCSFCIKFLSSNIKGMSFDDIKSDLKTKMSKDTQLSDAGNEYKIHPTPIGKGSFSMVYLGYDRLGSCVAIKKISLKKLPHDRIDKFNLELDISKKINHVNIVRCFKTFKTKKHWYIVTEYCDAGTLKDYIEQLKSIDTNENREKCVRDILIQLKEALHYLRNNNLIHRDLKPMNILFSNDKKNNNKMILKLADFGFARYFNSEQLTNDGYDSMISTICGSPIYMAPEMLLTSMYNIKADLWSFGVIMYEMLYGINPYNFPKSIPHLRELIVSQKIVFNDIYSTSCIDLLKALLVVDPKVRIDWDDFFEHEWFSGKKKVVIEPSKMEIFDFFPFGTKKAEVDHIEKKSETPILKPIFKPPLPPCSVSPRVRVRSASLSDNFSDSLLATKKLAEMISATVSSPMLDPIDERIAVPPLALPEASLLSLKEDYFSCDAHSGSSSIAMLHGQTQPIGTGKKIDSELSQSLNSSGKVYESYTGSFIRIVSKLAKDAGGLWPISKSV